MDRLYNSLRNQRFLQIHEIACILYDNIGVSGSPSESFTVKTIPQNFSQEQKLPSASPKPGYKSTVG